jgi:dienelactone hydrolase
MRFGGGRYRAAVMALLTLSGVAGAATQVPLTVNEGNQKYLGTLFLPDAPKKNSPLVVVVPEWWGKTAYLDKRGRQVADELGAIALVVDMYGDGKVVETPDEATALSGPFYQDPQKGVHILDLFLAHAPAAIEAAKASVDTSKVLAIGYCFGGTQVLNLLRSGEMPASERLAGVATFHGGLSSTMTLTHPTTTKLLVLHGAADQLVKPADVAAFKKEMKAAKVDMTFIAYPGAMHAFTNPQSTEVGKRYHIPIAYNASADKKSWAEFRKFYHELTGTAGR